MAGSWIGTICIHTAWWWLEHFFLVNFMVNLWFIVVNNWNNNISAWWWLEHDWIMTFYILEIIIPADFHIFQRGRYTTKQHMYPFFCHGHNWWSTRKQSTFIGIDLSTDRLGGCFNNWRFHEVMGGTSNHPFIDGINKDDWTQMRFINL